MAEVELTKGYIAIIDDDDLEHISRNRWNVLICPKTCYARRAVQVDYAKRTVMMHHQVMGFADGMPDGMVVDHINQNGLDNRKEKLRVCTRSQNCHNRRPRTDCKSKYKGVSRSGDSPHWISHVGSTLLGYFASEEDAALMYDRQAKILYGDFALLNFGGQDDGREIVRIERNDPAFRKSIRKITDEQVLAIYSRTQNGDSLEEIARDFGISAVTVKKIKYKMRYAHLLTTPDDLEVTPQ